MGTLGRSVGVRRAVGLVCAGALALAAGRAYADDSTSVIRVAVQIPGAAGVVEVAPEPAGHARTSAPLDAQGIATIRHLRPGRYTVTLTLASGPRIRQLVSIGSSEMLLLDVLQPPGIDIDPEMRTKERIPFQHGTEFRLPELGNLPAGDNLTTLLETAMPFVVVDRFSGGGLDVTRPGLVGSRGDSWTQSTLKFGDADFRTPTVRGWTFVPDLAIADSVAVRYGNLPLASSSPSAAIAIEPKRPAASWQHAIDVSLTTPDLVSKSGQTVAPTIVRLDSFAHTGVQSGGPIRKNASAIVSFFGSRGVQHERDRPAAVRAGIGSATGYVIATPTERDEVRVLAAAQGLHRPLEERRQFLDRGVTERQVNWFSQVTWDRVGRNGSFQELSFGGQYGGVTPRLWAPALQPGGTVERVFEGPVPDPASATVQRNMNARMRYAPPTVTLAGGHHHLDVGWSLDRTSLATRQVAAPPVAELVSGVPARVWIPDVVSRSLRQLTDAVVFAADRVSWSDKVTLDLGLRAALSYGSAEGALQQIAWRSLSPRVAVRVGWPIAVSAGIARYERPVSLSALAFGDPGAPLSHVYRWQDPNGDRAFDPSERGTLIALSGRNAAIASIDPYLQPPDLWEAYLGFERQLTRTMRFSATFNVKRGHHLPRSLNVGVPESSYRPVTVLEPLKSGVAGVPNAVVMYERLPQSFGLDRFVLTNVNNDGVGYEGVDVTWELRTRRWYSTFGGTAYSSMAAGGNRGFGVLEADHGVIGEQFETPNTTKARSVGKLFFDRDYVGKWSTSYLAPHDVVVSLTARYQDGQPFSRLILGPDLAQGADLIAADRPGRTRFTFTGTLDARIQKRFTVRRYEGAFGVDIFNLTNRADEVEENPIGGTAFRLATALQPPRTVRLRLRLSF